MCRPSCCDKNGGQGAGVAAVAIIIGAALTTGLVMALAVLTWAAITITRWQLRRRALAANATQMVTASTIRVQPSQPTHSADCLACGGTGTVLRAIGSGRYQPGECPVCEPITRAG